MRAVLQSRKVQKDLERLEDRRAKSSEILRQLLEQSNEVVEGTDLITGTEFSAGPLGWDCKELVLRASRTYSKGHDSEGKSKTNGHNQVNVKSARSSTPASQAPKLLATGNSRASSLTRRTGSCVVPIASTAKFSR